MLRRSLYAFAALALALSLAACGGVQETLDPVAFAAQKSADAGGVKMHLDASFSVKGQDASFSADGAFDGDEGEMTMDMGDLLAQTGLGAGPIKVVTAKEDGKPVVYVQMAALSSFIPGGKSWMKVNVEDALKQAGAGGSASDLFGSATQNPAEALELLKKVADVRTVGAETVEGAGTTHYRAEVDIEEALEQAGAPPAAIAAATTAGVSTTVPIDVWIGEDDGYVHRLKITYETSTAGGSVSGDVTMTFSDWGSDVSVDTPDEDEVFDASALLSLLGKPS